MFIFEKDKYFKECHAVSAIRLDNGDYIATWFGGSHEGKDDVDIWGLVCIIKNGSKPEKLIYGRTPIMESVLFYDSGLIALFLDAAEILVDGVHM